MGSTVRAVGDADLECDFYAIADSYSNPVHFVGESISLRIAQRYSKCE